MNLLSLPDEILEYIIELLNDDKLRPSEQWYKESSSSPLTSLDRVCRRFHHLTEKRLYYKILLDFTQMTTMNSNLTHLGPSPLDRLLDAFEAQPDRAQCIHNLKLRVCGYNVTLPRQPALQRLITFLRHSPNVRGFHLHCDGALFGLTPVLSAIATYQKIQTLEIDIMNIKPFLRLSNVFSELKNLTITSSISLDSERWEYQDSQWCTSYELPHAYRGMGQLQRLDFTCKYNPLTLLPLLQWTDSLEYLRLHLCGSGNGEMDNFTVDDLQNMLDTNSEGLEVIKISSYGLDEPLPDFKHFRNLERLEVSAVNLMADGYRDAARKLSAVWLADLVADFDKEDHWTYDQVFSDEFAAWFEGFSKEYRSIKPDDGIETIELRNVQDNLYGDANFENTVKALEEYGIVLEKQPGS